LVDCFPFLNVNRFVVGLSVKGRRFSSVSILSSMESLTLPTTAAQAKAFIAPSSLSFPMSHADQIAERNGLVNGASSINNSSAPASSAQTVNGTGAEQKETVTTGGVSGIVPTLQ
jgi:transcription initiation factor TFIID TATA-box-binding protein